MHIPERMSVNVMKVKNANKPGVAEMPTATDVGWESRRTRRMQGTCETYVAV